MYPDRLYALAFAFRKTKLWKSLYDTELFAVALPNGAIGYCCVMGLFGEHLALALYIGGQGLDSYRFLSELDERAVNPLKAQELMLCQNCLQCSFESKDQLAPEEYSAARAYASAHGLSIRGANAFPQFTSYRPAHYPWPVSGQEDIQLLCAALEAGLAVSEALSHTRKSQLGFREGPAYDRSIPLLTPSGEGFSWDLHPLPPKDIAQYQEPALRDELLMARLRRAKKRCGAWVCDVAMVPQPTEESETAPPVFPYTLLTAAWESRMSLPTEIVPDLESGADALLHALGNRMLEYGIPKEIQVVDKRTYALLKNLTAQLHIRLTLQPKNEFLDDVEADFLNYFASQTPEDVENEAMYISEMFMAMEDADLLSMPDELWKQLCALDGQDMLPRDMAARIRRLQKRRK